MLLQEEGYSTKTVDYTKVLWRNCKIVVKWHTCRDIEFHIKRPVTFLSFGYWQLCLLNHNNVTFFIYITGLILHVGHCDNGVV